MEACNCEPQSQRQDPKISPVTQELCTRTRMGSFGSHDPLIRATCCSPVFFCVYADSSKSPHYLGSLTDTSLVIRDALVSLYSIRHSGQLLFKHTFLAI